MQPDHPTNEQRLDQAVSHRLAQMRRPVDISHLTDRLEASIASSQQTHRPTAPLARIGRWVSLAASIAIVAGMTILFSSSSDPALATPVMFQLHEDIQNGRVPMVRVKTMDEARHTVAAAWANAPELPRTEMPPESCCLRDVKDRRVVCIALRTAEVPITVVVARTDDFHPGGTATHLASGQTGHVSTFGSCSMVVTQHGDRWLCVMADMPVEQLKVIAAQIGF
jgi:hypothetical protein